ncbi:MAG: GGDEF domain-containing protein [Planctomycetota bacterium]
MSVLIANAIREAILSPVVLMWVIPCVLVSIGIGVAIGHSIAIARMPRRIRRDREDLLSALQRMLNSVDQLSDDMGNHNTELTHVGRTVTEFHAKGDLEDVQNALLTQITQVVKSNKKMQDDLVVSKYELRQQAEELDKTRREARTDQLSGLGNRKSFDEAFQFALTRFKRNHIPFALILADVDHFKRINDTYGHQSGDLIVTRIGKVLKQLCRHHDHVSRYGGDEFAVLLMGADRDACRRVGARIRAAIERTNFQACEGGSRIAVTFSMGMAFPLETDTLEELFERADQALYHSKNSGRNQLFVYKDPQAIATDEAVPSENADTSEQAETAQVC